MRIFLLVLSLFTLCGCAKRAEVKKEKIGSAELAYYIRGSGEPLVMIMGFRGTMAIWDPALLDILEKKYTLILFDNRGVGFSTSGDEPITIPKMAEDTAQLIKALGYDKAHILGWSMGSRIAMELAINYPEMVESLILCSPNPGGDYQARRKTEGYKELTSKKMTEKEGLSLIFPGQPKAAESFVDRLTRAMLKGTVPEDINVSPEIVEQQVHALNLWDENNHIYEQLPSIKIPTLVAGGLNDVLDQPDNVKIVANRIPFAWTAYFPGAGHDFLSQDYQHFGDLVILFLESNK